MVCNKLLVCNHPMEGVNMFLEKKALQIIGKLWGKKFLCRIRILLLLYQKQYRRQPAFIYLQVGWPSVHFCPQSSMFPGKLSVLGQWGVSHPISIMNHSKQPCWSHLKHFFPQQYYYRCTRFSKLTPKVHSTGLKSFLVVNQLPWNVHQSRCRRCAV